MYTNSWGALSAPFLLVHCRGSAFVLRLLHDEDERQHTNEDDHHEAEGVIESQHVGLAIHHSHNRGVGLAGGSRCVGYRKPSCLRVMASIVD